ncbi:MAG: putative DNA-binding protein [Oscillospiraceae bacterium]|nr:putative DNA-binding protein [Oscillospiraceae bacterium]
MDKDFNISVLMDFYGELLTSKQFEALDYYYNQDYSLQEIAEHMDISRQGVRDFIKRGERQLEDFEQKLGLAKKFSELSAFTDKLIDYINELEDNKEDNKPVSDIIAEIKNTLFEIKNNL